MNAFDDLSGLGQISFSFDGETWTNWKAFINEKQITLLPGDGEKTVYFRVKDNAGNVAEPVSATILLNTAEPEIESEKPSKPRGSYFEFWHWLIIIIVILLLAFLILAAHFTKRLRRLERKLLVPGSLTIKPSGLGASMITAGKLAGPAASEQLTGDGATTGLISAGSTATVPIPILAKSTETATAQAQAHATTTQARGKHPKLPQLPPAQIQKQPETSTSTEPIELPGKQADEAEAEPAQQGQEQGDEHEPTQPQPSTSQTTRIKTPGTLPKGKTEPITPEPAVEGTPKKQLEGKKIKSIMSEIRK
jgi:hypothetical protein